ncbi:MAG: hypothetical protein HY526_08765 [Betaproteobacteria bacterium]|nr:hypothetical protein [Betaproteobacteria bacterium]
MATTQISLVREHTDVMKPPRALWVPFVLGRPFGVPNDAAFQRRVLIAVLRLLEAPSGPVLEGYPEEAPQPVGDEAQGFACPVSFSRPGAEDGLAGKLQNEIADLAPWYELARRERGRTTAALSGLTAEAAARFVTDFIADPALPSYREDLTRVLALRLVCQDLKAYYLEAVAAQPGARAALEAQQWFWRDTVAGGAFFELREACLKSDDELVRRFGARGIVPMAITPGPGG